MINHEPAMPRPDAMKKPDCPKCGAGMWLIGIESAASGHELLSFECPTCQHIEAVMWKSNRPHFSLSP